MNFEFKVCKKEIKHKLSTTKEPHITPQPQTQQIPKEKDTHIMAIGVVEFSREGYKIRKFFA